MAIGSVVGQMKGGLMISACALKVSQGLVGQSTRTVQAGSRRERQLTGRIECPREVQHGSLWGIERLRLCASTLAILQRFFPYPCFKKMSGEICQMRFDRRGVETFEGLGNRAM